MPDASAISIVFPHQLYDSHPALHPSRPVFLLEEPLYFTQYRFHKQKLVLHIASMEYYAALLQERGYRVQLIRSQERDADIRNFIAACKAGTIHYCDTTDNWLEKRIHQAATAHNIEIARYASPNFLTTPEAWRTWFDSRKKYFQTDFYIAQRKQRNLLLEQNGQPLGGKWTYDTENRQRYPAGKQPPLCAAAPENNYTRQAMQRVDKLFPGHYGQTTPFIYPVTHADAEAWLDQFLQERFAGFGPYEDAIVKDESILHHGVLTPMMNIGLLQPQQVIDKSIDAAIACSIPLPSLEGFIRQVTGWREFIRIVYEREGSRQRTRNYWQFTRKIPASFWTGETGILPVDHTIRKLLRSGYNHHIERLMILGNFMLLCEFDPDEVYRWFMEMYVDSYDWVMVPNVYGMTQFADGGLMTTKPYISGSNYIRKMSDYPKGNWTITWDALFWRFMHVHRDFFLQNPRLGMLVKTFDKMPAAKQKAHLDTAELFLQNLDHENG